MPLIPLPFVAALLLPVLLVEVVRRDDRLRAGGKPANPPFLALIGISILQSVLLRLQKQMAGYKLLIIDELGFVPLSKTGAELLFKLISRRYERGATRITRNLPFDEWTETFGSERLTGALLDRLTHHVHILEMSGDSYRLVQSRARKAAPDT